MWRVRLGLSVTLIACLATSAVPVAAQERTETPAGPIARAMTREAVRRAATTEPASGVEAVQQNDKPAMQSNWPRGRTLGPGTEIIVTVKTSPPGRRVVVLEDASELTVLNLTDPTLPRAARNVLRDMAANHANYFAVADRHGSFVNGNVRVAPDGVFVADRKVADLGQVIEHIARADVAEITGPGGAPLTADRPVEIGVGVGGVMSLAGGGGGDLRVTVTVPRSERRSIEGFVGIYRGNDFFDTRGVYGFQIKQQIARGRRPGFAPFATFGLIGLVARYESYDCLYASCRPHMSTHVLPPLLGLAGLGVQYSVTPHLAVRLESQAAIALIIPVGVRVAAGVSIPLGRVTSDSPAAVSK